MEARDGTREQCDAQGDGERGARLDLVRIRVRVKVRVRVRVRVRWGWG